LSKEKDLVLGVSSATSAGQAILAGGIKRIPLARPVIDEEMKEAAIQALQNERLVLGESVHKFEEEFAQYSGTAALTLSLMAQGVDGGEVVTSPTSFVASANSVIHAGATPKFADINLQDYTIDPSKLRRSLCEKTKAVIPVHLFGFPAKMDEICRIASERRIPIIEDACLPPGQEICTSSGWAPIEQVQVYDRVLGCDGRFHRVIKLYERPYSGELLTIVPWSMSFPLTVTPKHPILACRAYRGNGKCTIRPTFADYEKCGKATRHYRHAVCWTSADSLNIGDFLLIPIPSCFDIHRLGLKQEKRSWNSKSLPEGLDITPELLYISGLYIAEGAALDDCVEISNASDAIVGKYCRAMDDTFDLGYCVYDRDGYQLVRTYCRQLSRLFISWFGTHSYNKRIPEWIWMLSPEKISHFIKGLWDGDGSHYENQRHRKILAYRTVSQQLAKQLALLLTRIDIISTIQESGVGFDIRVQSDDSGKRLAELLGLEWNQPVGCSRSSACFFHDDYLWVPIRDIKRSEYNGPVHNVEVESSNSYLAEFVMTHNCQAHGALLNGRRAGSIGDVGCFSFFSSKNMTVGGDGGMIVTDDESIADSVRSLRDCGRAKGSKYLHTRVGFTERLNTVQAAIGRIQLKRLDRWNESRRAIASEYDTLLSDLDDLIRPPIGNAAVRPVYHMYVIRSSRRDDLRAWLDSAGVETGIHYPDPIHLQPIYRETFGYEGGEFPNSEAFCKSCLSIPMHPNLTRDEVKSVSESIHQFYNQRS
jgi:dTDP-4-amino-4,6-dideoxygalactose transaminase